MTKVFLSHSSRDDRYVAEFESFVRAMFVDNDGGVFNDVRSIPAGQEFWPQIEKGIQTCERFVLIVSEDSVQSAWVQREVALARSLEKRIVPVRIDGCDASALFDGRDIVDFRPGRGNRFHFNTKSLPATHTGKLYGRDTELGQLFADLADPDVRIVAFDAMGGSGKTALITEFVHQLQRQGWRKLQSVFVWSFYSQGSSEDKQTHAADFFKAAYAHFHPKGKDAQLPDASRDQGEELAKLIADQPTLLVLDGLEPLQYAASGTTTGAYPYGGIKDPGVKILLTQLAVIGPPLGLTIVTTRIAVHEVDKNPSFRRHRLDQLPTDAAIDLLRDLGIEANTFPRTTHPSLPAAVKAEFEKTIADLKHHALSLNLAARLVAEHHQGQIRAFADVIPALHDAADQDIHENHRSPFRVMRALEAGLFRVLHNRLQRMSAAEAIDESPAANQLCLLYFLGLFDRPASLEHLPVVYDASQDLRDAVPMLPEDKAEYLQKVAKAAAIRDAVLQDPHSTDDARLEARHQFEDTFYDLSFHYWLPPVFARFDPRPESDNRSVTNALTQLSQQNLVSKARLKTGEGGHVEWETLPPKEWFSHHVDCHPLIREYFGHQLRKKYPKAFQEAHGRLYDWFRFEGLEGDFRDPVPYALLGDQVAYPNYGAAKTVQDLISGKMDPASLANTAPALLNASPDQLRAAAKLIDTPEWKVALTRFLPTTEAGMTPLFAAIGHGCLAGRHTECWSEVYWPRIARGNENYACKKLGLYGQELAAVASFFEKPFGTPHPGLQASRQALVLNLAGFRLRAIGRLPDAVEPFRSGMQGSADAKDWKGAASDAGNLSELLLTLGQVERDEAGEPGALPTAARAVAFADQSGDLFQRMGDRAKHANALLAAGRLREAEERFREAEALQRQRQPTLPRLYSLQGFLYGDLLLARGRAAEVLDRYEYLVSCRMDGDSILDRALEELLAARARVRLASSQPSTKNQEPETHPPFLPALLDANAEEFVARGYLAQAEIRLEALGFGREVPESSSLQPIASSLEEAETRARRGPMPLFACEAALLRARLALAASGSEGGKVKGGKVEEARKYRDEAAKLIETHGYGRRKPDLAVLDCEIDPSLETFQTACGHVQSEGWWELLPRLEALVANQPKGGWFGGGERKKWDALLEPLRKAEKAYQAERDGYLREVENEAAAKAKPKASAAGGGVPGELADQLLAQLPQEVIQQIATQTGAPADWKQWPDELKAAVVQAVLKSQQGG